MPRVNINSFRGSQTCRQIFLNFQKGFMTMWAVAALETESIGRLEIFVKCLQISIIAME